jgi:hypothetical protein
MIGTWTAELRQCSGCGWWAHWLSDRGRCKPCLLGWAHCQEHGRLEYAAERADPDAHAKVTIAEVCHVLPPSPGPPALEVTR